MTILQELAALIGPENVLTGDDTAPFRRDWTGKYTSRPLAVVRPASTGEVAGVVRLAGAAGVPVVPVSGNTGLVGGTANDGALMLSLARMNRIRDINPASRTATAEAGVVLDTLNEAAETQDLIFPLAFGARGSATVGGVLSTNAGGSNALRYGTARALCLGIEAVLPSGAVMNLMSALHKDNTGYDLRNLMIGAEGTLGIITAAVVKLAPRPRARATALVGLETLDAALDLLNRLQAETGGAVEAFEYMPAAYMRRLARHRPDLHQPFATPHPVNVLVEVAATTPRDATPRPDGALPVVALLENALAAMLEAGTLRDARVAQSETQRAHLWTMREAAAEITFTGQPVVDSDVALPLDRVGAFLARCETRLHPLDPKAEILTIGHLGDGNLHHAVYPTENTPEHLESIREAVEDVVAELGGSFSAEHGIGLSKKGTMARRKDRAALDAMRAIKQALDPAGIMNPGKLLPED